MQKFWIVLLATFFIAACESKPADEAGETTAEEAAAEEPSGEETEIEGDEPADANKKVVVAAAGTTFDPPVEKGQIPDGAYICDMGTVHYAQMEKGDGKCPECGMMLKVHGVTKAESPTAGASTEHDHDHAGHDHDDHDGHDHDGHDGHEH